MTRKNSNRTTAEIKALMAEDGEFLRPIVRTVIQEFLEAEMSEAIGAQKGERVESRSGYRSGYYPRSLITRVGKLELRVPQDRNGRFSTDIFERYQRSEKALVAALTQMYIQGVSTRKVKTISEELCGHSFSASTISGFNKKLDEELGRFSRRQLDCEYPYLILDARYEKVRENAVIRSRAVLVAIGIDWEGRRQVLGVEMADRESSTSWKEFLVGLKRRGLRGVIFAVSDDHPGLKRAIMEVVPEAYWSGGCRTTCTFYATRSTICLARSPTTAWLNCAGFTIGVTPRKPAEIWQLGFFGGRRNIQGSALGWKKTSRKPSPFTACRESTTNISKARTCSSGLTRS
jgi:putative transposase